MVEKIIAVTAIALFYVSTVDEDRVIFETIFCADNIKNAILPTHYSRQVCQ